jgi:hypothetical protein
MAFEITVSIGLTILLGALGGGIAVVVTATDSPGFLVARILFIVAAVDAIGFAVWLTSRTLHVTSWQWVLAALVAFVSIGGLVATLQWTNYREAMSSKELSPGNAPMPIDIAKVAPEIPISANTLFVFFGNNSVAWGTEMPHTILTMGREPMIVIDRVPNSNKLVLSVLRIFDDRGNIIARVDDEGFWVENSTRNKRPDPGTLTVFDHSDKEVLRMVFLNPRAISVTGIFRRPQSMYPVIINPTEIFMGNNKYTRIFAGGSGKADISAP